MQHREGVGPRALSEGPEPSSGLGGGLETGSRGSRGTAQMRQATGLGPGELWRSEEGPPRSWAGARDDLERVSWAFNTGDLGQGSPWGPGAGGGLKTEVASREGQSLKIPVSPR